MGQIKHGAEEAAHQLVDRHGTLNIRLRDDHVPGEGDAERLRKCRAPWGDQHQKAPAVSVLVNIDGEGRSKTLGDAWHARNYDEGHDTSVKADQQTALDGVAQVLQVRLADELVNKFPKRRTLAAARTA